MRHFYQDGVNFYRKSDVNEKTWQNNILTIMLTFNSSYVHFSICIEKTTKTGGGVNWNSVQLALLVGHQLALPFQKPYNFR